MDFNPYQSPSISDAAVTDIAALNEMVKAWEKLRRLYNLVLILPGMGVLALWLTRTEMPFLMTILCGVLVGLGANAAFFLGPLAELYVRVFFRRGDTLGKGRWLIFSAGLVVSAGIFLLAAMIPFI